MALLPDPKVKPAKGSPGQFQNMEEWNAFSAFVTGTSTKAIGFGNPVSRSGVRSDGTATVKALATTEVFVGVARENIVTGSTGTDASTTYADDDLIGIADEGVIFGLAGAALTAGGNVFWDPATNTYVAATGAGILPLPNCSYDQSAASGDVVAIRLRVVPGGAAVTAGT